MRQCLRATTLVLLAMLTGCQGGGLSMIGNNLSIASSESDNDTRVSGNFNIAVYSVQDMDTLHILLIDGTEDQPNQVVHIQMYWRPRAGLTPLDASATNAAVRYALFEGDQVALYGGGGMLRPGNTPGANTFRAALANVSLRLMDADQSHHQPVGITALAQGRFTARRDDQRTTELIRKMQIHLKDKLGYPRFIGSANE